MKKSFLARLKERWGVRSNGALLVIFIVFSITGSSALKLARPVLDFIGLERSVFETTGTRYVCIGFSEY